MANGWAPDGAVQDQIDDTVLDGVLRARAQMPTGEAATHCLECGEEIPEPRRRVLLAFGPASIVNRRWIAVR